MNAIITLCHFCERHGPRILFCTQPFHPNEVHPDNEQETSLSLDSGIHSLPNLTSAANTTEPPNVHMKHDLCEGCSSIQSGYVSRDDEANIIYVSTQHPRSHIFSMIRQACIRSLSCEVCPGREGPIFFGDEHQGQVLSYTFYLKDSQARGFQRLYSILVIMMDKVYLLNSWPFLVPNIKTIVSHLQAKAERVHDEEQIKCPQRAYRLGSSTNPANRGGNNPGRSIVELTNDRNVFKMFHTCFVWLLKACGNRITETLLEGPPTEDSIIDMEKQEETEEGFIKLFKQENDTSEAVGVGYAADNSDGESDTSSFKSPKQLMKILGYEDFHKLAHHVVIGNQIIVISEKKKHAKSFLGALMPLLPKGCCRTVFYSHQYEESWRCNFLGVPPDVSIPAHVISNEMFILVDIVEVTDSDKNRNDSSAPGVVGDFSNLSFKLSSPLILPEKAPSVLIKMEMALQNESFNDAVIEQCLVCIKEEWMNKVKVLFKFTKAGGNRSEDDTKKLLDVVGARVEDKGLLKFWMTGLSVQYRTHILSSSRIQQSAMD